LLGSSKASEREAAHQKINEILLKHKLNWNDLPEIIRSFEDEKQPCAGGPEPPDDQDDIGVTQPPLAVVV
jgi:hypothetical protein